MINVLVLCTGNSARSILGEVLFNERGAGRIEASSAGSQPAGRVNPGALAKLEREGLPTTGLRSKSWDEFAGDDGQHFSIVITVCDNAAGETCPVWHGSPVRVHWGIPDPAIQGSDDEIRAAFDAAYAALERRILATLELPLESMQPEAIRSALSGIHASS